jgi:hypothetical protein
MRNEKVFIGKILFEKVIFELIEEEKYRKIV